jgi:PleD family two-component response regulator
MEEKKYRILIIDDDSFILNMYVAKFVKAGHEVETAKSGTEAITKVKDGYTPDIVLVDMVLPDMNGLTFLSEVRTQKLAAEAAYIMFTNQNSHEEMDKAKDFGIAGYIIKANLIPSEAVAKVIEVAKEFKK